MGIKSYLIQLLRIYAEVDKKEFLKEDTLV